VQVALPQGGEASGVSIDAGSTLIGAFSYSGNNDRVFLKFSRVDSPDGDSRKIAAQALDASDYSPGVTGEAYTGDGVKIATSIGLTMFSGMTDTLTQRESLGDVFGGVQATPTMKNALLQGASQAAHDQAGRVASSIGREGSYVIIPEGKEMIVELSEDFGK
jgi:type IV secretory pathway VirB10-like protein